jgi:hypothetical protein
MVCWLAVAVPVVPAVPAAAGDEPTVELYAGTVEG